MALAATGQSSHQIDLSGIMLHRRSILRIEGHREQSDATKGPDCNGEPIEWLALNATRFAIKVAVTL